MSERWVHVPSHLMNRYPSPEEEARREREIEMRRQIEAENRQKRKARMFETFVIVPIRAVRRLFKTVEERTRPE